MISRIWRAPVGTIACVLLILLVIQFTLPIMLPLEVFYRNRIDYMKVKDNASNFDLSFQAVKRDIDSRHLTDYVILLGDSVMFGSPGNSDQTLNAYLSSSGTKVYNLSFPGTQIGDIYAMLLKLDELGISTHQVIFNVRYASFVARMPGQTALAWFEKDLRRLDPTAYAQAPMQQDAPSRLDWHEPLKPVTDGLYDDVFPRFAPYLYRDFMNKWLDQLPLRLKGQPVPPDIIQGGDSRPWFEKEDLDAYMKSPIVAAAFNPDPFVLDDGSPDAYFYRKISEHQQGTHTLAVLTGANRSLAKDYVRNPGYLANLQRLEQFLEHSTMAYINMDGRIDDSLFTDHTHLTPEGYRQLANILQSAYPL